MNHQRLTQIETALKYIITAAEIVLVIVGILFLLGIGIHLPNDNTRSEELILGIVILLFVLTSYNIRKGKKTYGDREDPRV